LRIASSFKEEEKGKISQKRGGEKGERKKKKKMGK